MTPQEKWSEYYKNMTNTEFFFDSLFEAVKIMLAILGILTVICCASIKGCSGTIVSTTNKDLAKEITASYRNHRSNDDEKGHTLIIRPAE